MSYFPSWTVVGSDSSQAIVAPEQRHPWPQMILMGLQHVVALFGAAVIAPLLMGFNPNVAILMSGVGALLFFVVVGGRVPSYLGSSFAFIGFVAVSMRGMVQRPMLLVGVLASYAIYYVLLNHLGLAKPIDFGTVASAPWFGIPQVSSPIFTVTGITLTLPIALILVAENLGHVKAVAAMTGQNMDRYVGRAFLGDGLATMVSGQFGGTGVTTYAENICVMAVTKIYSTLMFVMAAIVALVLGFSPKFGAVIQTIPAPILSGVSIVVFGLIAVAGMRIWMNEKVDLNNSKNLIVASAVLVMGTGDFTLHLGNFALGGIGTATFGGIALYALLSALEVRFQRTRSAEESVGTRIFIAE